MKYWPSLFGAALGAALWEETIHWDPVASAVSPGHPAWGGGGYPRGGGGYPQTSGAACLQLQGDETLG